MITPTHSTATDAWWHRLVGLDRLMQLTEGNASVKVGIIDGPVANNVGFQRHNVTGQPGPYGNWCTANESHACRHGTMVTGLLAGKRNTASPGICPGCSILVRQLFCEDTHRNTCPIITSRHLAEAIVQLINAGAKIINMSVGLSDTALTPHPELTAAFDLAFQKGVLLIAASGNHGRIGQLPLFSHAWIIPVAACDQTGRPLANANYSRQVGASGLLAPGKQIACLDSEGGFANFTGTSVAAPLVTGTTALLWSLFPRARAGRIRQALLHNHSRQRTVIPPLLNAVTSYNFLTKNT